MKKSLLIFTSALIFVSQLYTQWATVSTGGTKDLNSISFYSATGFAVGDSGLVKKSLNFGSTWSTLPFVSTTNLNSVYSTSSSHIYACGEQGLIYKTTNSGTNWVVQTTSTPGINYQKIDFIDSFTGIVVGDNRRFAYTANGGTNWITGQLNVPVGANLNYRAVDLYDNTTSYIASSDTLIGMMYHSYILRSTNNGVSYTNLLTFTTGNSNPFVHIQFVNSTTGFAITNKGYCIKTTNGGSSWTNYLMNMFCESAFFINAVTGYACGTGGGLKKTTNGGVTWLWQNSPTTLTLSSITCTDTVTSISAGFDGTIVKTNNGGTFTGINQYSTEIPGNYSLSQNYPNPFNPSTNITFDIPNASNVKLALFNVLGTEVKVLANEYLTAGKYSVNLSASELPSGTYFYRLTAGKFSDTKKMILIK